MQNSRTLELHIGDCDWCVTFVTKIQFTLHIHISLPSAVNNLFPTELILFISNSSKSSILSFFQFINSHAPHFASYVIKDTSSTRLNYILYHTCNYANYSIIHTTSMKYLVHIWAYINYKTLFSTNCKWRCANRGLSQTLSKYTVDRIELVINLN